jgi:hypothetical protein
MGKFLDAVERLNIGFVELSHSPDQSSQVRCHRWLYLFLVVVRREQMHVQPLRLDVHIDQEPL